MEDPKNFYPRYSESNCSDCCRYYYTKWGQVRQNNYDLFLPENNIIAACRNEKGFYPYRDERGLGMSELRKPTDYVLASSGALSLGTTAGTDRSISAEFGGTVPHALSEYYGVASGVPSSGTIDFSDFYGASAGPPVTDCLWTHYDLSECTENDAVCNFTTSAYAMCAQTMCIGRWEPYGTGPTCPKKICTAANVYQGCICKYDNGIHTNRNYLYTECFLSVVSHTTTAYWGGVTALAPYDNSVFMVAKACSPTLNTGWNMRNNTGYYGFCSNEGESPYNAWPTSPNWHWMNSGFAWQPGWQHKETANRVMGWYIFGHSRYKCSSIPSGQNQVVSQGKFSRYCIIACPLIIGHAVTEGLCCPDLGIYPFSPPGVVCYTPILADCVTCSQVSRASTAPGCEVVFGNCNYCRYFDTSTSNEGGRDYWNVAYRWGPSHQYSGVAECVHWGEYMHYQCKLTTTQVADTVEYLADKWYRGL